MAGIQHMQLEPFIGLHIRDQLRASPFPSRAWASEPVLDHPLGEGLAADTCIVDQSQRSCDSAAARLCGGGDDAIDDGSRKAYVSFDLASNCPLSLRIRPG